MIGAKFPYGHGDMQRIGHDELRHGGQAPEGFRIYYRLVGVVHQILKPANDVFFREQPALAATCQGRKFAFLLTGWI